MLCENIDIIVANEVEKWIKAGGLETAPAYKRGFERGIKKGHTAMFKTAVTGGFGSIPGHIEAQIDAASFDQLVEWSKQLFATRNLDAVFSAN
jgi:hypothetical protein